MRQVIVLTQRELKSAFRETSVVLYSVLLPLLLYPFLLWLMVTTLTFIEGQGENRVYRVGYDSTLSEGSYADFLTWLEGKKRIKLLAVEAGNVGLSNCDALLQQELLPNGQSTLVVAFVGSRPESSEAQSYLQELQQDFNVEQRAIWLKGQGLESESGRPFLVKGTSTAASGDVGGYLLGALLPIGLLVMIALGGAYPAIDTTAGERERGTWETMQSCQPSMGTVLLSKYLFVSIVCTVSGVLNLVAMLVSIRSIVAPLLRDNSSITFSVGPKTLLVLLVGVLCVSFFVAAALLLCSIFARTFREGQALTTPMFMLIALPVLPLSDPGLELNAKLALVPLVNLALVWRQALLGIYHVPYIILTLGCLGSLIAFALWVGSRLLLNEALMSGSGPELNWKRFYSIVVGVFLGRK